MSWNETKVQNYLDGFYLEFHPLGGTQQMVAYGGAARALKPCPCLRQNSLISLFRLLGRMRIFQTLSNTFTMT